MKIQKRTFEEKCNDVFEFVVSWVAFFVLVGAAVWATGLAGCSQPEPEVLPNPPTAEVPIVVEPEPEPEPEPAVEEPSEEEPADESRESRSPGEEAFLANFWHSLNQANPGRHHLLKMHVVEVDELLIGLLRADTVLGELADRQMEELSEEELETLGGRSLVLAKRFSTHPRIMEILGYTATSITAS